MIRYSQVVLVSLPLVLAGCWYEARRHREAEQAEMKQAVSASALLFTSQAAAAEKREGDWGTIKGQIVWAGDKIPAPKEVDVSKATPTDQEHCLSKGPIYSEEWVINKDNKGVRWVFVWLADTTNPNKPKAPAPIHPDLKEIKEKKVYIDQPCCKFEPHALGMREGQILVAKNSSNTDPSSKGILHNVNWQGFKNPGGNEAVGAGKELEIDNLKADKYPVSIACNIHGWMSAKVWIFSHPYFAVTDKDGKFEIKNVPAGNWSLVAWSDNGYRGGAEGKKGVPVEIKAGSVNDLGKLEIKPND